MLDLLEIGVIGLVIFFTIFLISLPIFATIIIGTALAYQLNLHGLLWWIFIIFFYIIITVILGYILKQ